MITVMNSGLFSTIQDTGRWGYQAYGMPVAGAMDLFSCQVANLLVGNQPQAAVIEMTLSGGSFRFEQECYVAIAGSDMEATMNGVPVANWSAFCVPAGGELVFSYAVTGCRTYLAVYGGIDVPLVLGSRATYTRAGIGGLEGRTLKCGDILKAGRGVEKSAMPRILDEQYIPQYASEIKLRVLLGPQDNLFTAQGIQTFFSATYTISTDADRMGYRLEGPAVEHNAKADIVSDALCQGAIQVPGHGMPIIMMADRQTTGGYTKIGAVIGSDLALLAQARPGDTVRFIECTDEEAVAALRDNENTYLAVKAELDNWASTSDGMGIVRTLLVTINGQTYNVEIEER